MSLNHFQGEGLRLLGYSERESEFLSLVATHSGYFTNHQFKSFVGTDSGSVSHSFIRKLLGRTHATYRAYRSGERVYHLFARKVYQAIERENLRTRKKHELEYVKTRLVTLDFVLAHTQHKYLETEARKLAFFEKECGLDRGLLPVKLYRARKSADVSPRYFVDRFPLFIDSEQGALTFTYVDAGAITLDGFRTHLRGYSELFRRLAAFNFTYVAPTKRLFEAAETEFRKAASGCRSGDKSPNLLDYFRIRRAWNAKERVASSDVLLLKEAQAMYAGRRFDELYNSWRDGAVNDAEVMREVGQLGTESRCFFRTFLCGDSLKVFREPLPGSAESWGDSPASDTAPRSSNGGSLEVSGT